MGFFPDCPVCGAAMAAIRSMPMMLRASKRTCPSCHRRFAVTLTRGADGHITASYERIPDYQKPKGS